MKYKRAANSKSETIRSIPSLLGFLVMELARCPFSSARIPTAPWTATCGRRHTQIGPRGLGFQAFETFLAGAIQKAVRWTGCTKSQECAVKSSPRPMKPHAQIVCRDAQRFRHFAARLTEQIHLPDQLGILARHRWQYPVKATANGPLGIIVDFQHRTFRYLETLQRRFSYTCAPVVIGHRSRHHGSFASVGSQNEGTPDAHLSEQRSPPLQWRSQVEACASRDTGLRPTSTRNKGRDCPRIAQICLSKLCQHLLLFPFGQPHVHPHEDREHDEGRDRRPLQQKTKHD